MRFLLAAAVALAASPALAGDLSPDLTAKLLALAQSERASGADRCDRAEGAKIGMGAEGVLRSCWGRPIRINTTTTASHTHEQWVYAGGYVYLDDGVVTAIQTSR